MTDVEDIVRAFSAFADQEKDADVLLNYYGRVAQKIHKDTMEESPRLTIGAAVHKAVEMIETYLLTSSVRGSKGSGAGSTTTKELSRPALEKLGVRASPAGSGSAASRTSP